MISPRISLAFLFMLIMSAQGAGAGGSMLSVFPEDLARRGASFSGRAGQHGFSPPRQARLEDYRQDARRLLRAPPHSLRGETQLACMAVAVFHEARGESLKGQRAVASVVLQRAMTPGRWGGTPCDVVRPVQFSFMTSRFGFPSITEEDGWEKSWGQAIGVAARTLADGPMPELKGADHYHARYVHPSWQKKMLRTAVIGNHYFYADPKSPLPAEFQHAWIRN